MMIILIPALLLGLLGMVFGLVLAYASKKFHVEIDPKVEAVTEALPSANCGACGFPGCAGYADAIVQKGMDISLCAPGGTNSVKKIADIMGLTASEKIRNIAVIHCQSGGYNNTFFRYEYKGLETCKAAALLSNGPNLCSWGCVFQFDCVKICKFDALHVDENGIRVVDPEKCTGCGACVKVCPKSLIDLVPVNKEVHVLCASRDKGVVAKNACGNKTACIGCGICSKKCPVQAITITNNLAIIDYEKCISCGLCAKACPTKAILDLKKERKKAVIDPDLCIGCTICAKKCPVQAIKGELKSLHVIENEKCIGCEICVDKCPKKAIHLV